MHYPTHSTSGPMSVMNARPLKVCAWGFANRTQDPYYIDESEAFSNETALFYTSLGLAGAACWFVHRFLCSPLGEALSAIRTNETRLEYLGISARWILLIAYVLSAVLAGLGGSIIAVNQGVVTPDLGYWIRSGEFVFIAILGGAGHVLGAFAGALIYELVRFYAAAMAANVWQMILGFVLLGIILFASRGIVGLYRDLAALASGSRSHREPLR